mgnify:CR=1 FL=1|tara:strand:- start:3336 stop:3659 length:324 start_codon:yes stop_codon:yes gene_type:complete
MKKEHEWIDDDKRYILRADKWNWILISGNSELDDEAYFSNAERWYFTDFIEFSKKLFSIKSREEVLKLGFDKLPQVFTNAEKKLERIYSIISSVDEKKKLGVKNSKR